jgi:hypothetical protein
VGGEVLVGVDQDLFLNLNVGLVFADHANRRPSTSTSTTTRPPQPGLLLARGGSCCHLRGPRRKLGFETDAGAKHTIRGRIPRAGRRWIPYIQPKSSPPTTATSSSASA